MGHVHCGIAKNRRITGVMKQVTEMEGGTAAVVYIDYKMKLDPIRHRESRAQFYEKRG